MAPEQLRGEAVTAKSDLYALGLVLYELFTGKKPFDAQSVQQLIDMQQSMHLTSVVSVASDVDPAVEKIIRRCLDPDPSRRPASAVSVAAALPGGDPLAAALAAGETPSPEMVAAAGTFEGLARKYSIPLLLAVILSMVAVIPIRQARTAAMHAHLDRSPEVLAHESRLLAAQFGHTERPADSYVWMESRSEMTRYLTNLPKPHLWDQWYASISPVASFYRESRRPLVASPDGNVTVDNPPPTVPGMTQTILDGEGRLLQFDAVPDDRLPPFSQPVTAESVFHAAGLDMNAFREIDPSGAPPNAFDARRTWRGPHPVLPKTELRLDVAWWKGRITRAKVYFPWSTDAAATVPPRTFTTWLRENAAWLLQGLGGFFVILLARRNWKRNRADVRGAWQVALTRLVLAAIAWVGWTHPVESDAVINNFFGAAGDWLVAAAIIWFVYMALEPEVRSRWPHSIVTWNRVLAGRWKDARVGSEILLGAACGATMWILFKLFNYISGGNTEPTNHDLNLFAAASTRHWVSSIASTLGNALWMGIIIFLAVFGLRHILRRDWLAVLAAAALFTTMEGGAMRSSDFAVMFSLYVVVYGVLIFLLLRFGLVATITTIFFANSFNTIGLGTSWKTWYTPLGLATVTLLLSIAVWAFVRSLGGRELIGEE
jgi:serine/threonine-protein kinase